VENIKHVDKIRDLKAMKIGMLCVFTGTVTRSSEIRPELIAGSFICLMCNKKIDNVE
jgi:DNA replication licensing factor MCM6